ncbi:MAG: type II toxin-antitoxin system VapC family toxin [Xanthobacteraceae bacterium]
MSIYFDVNVLVALFVADPLNDQADKAVRSLRDDVIVSNLSVAEFSAVIARRVRTRDLSGSEARTAFIQFDTWCADYSRTTEMESTDIATATVWMRRLDFPLRTPDALHIAIAQRTGCTLLTFDRTMARVARTLGLAIAKG